MKNYVNHDDLGAFLPAKARDLEKLPCSLVVFPAEILFCKVSRGAIFMKRRLQLFMQKFLLFIKSLKLAAGWKKMSLRKKKILQSRLCEA